MQQTLAAPIQFEGVGIHTGKSVAITLQPAPENHGIVFCRTDLPNQPLIPADADLVADTTRSTTLQKNEAKVSTIEHLLAALTGSGIDNVLINTNSAEMPIMDGSAQPFIQKINAVGVKTQNTARVVFSPTEPIYFQDEAKGAQYTILPANNLHITTMVNYQSKILGMQYAQMDGLEQFNAQIAQARTFCFLHELQAMLQANLLKGGTLNNAIVVVENPVDDTALAPLATAFNLPQLKVTSAGYLNNTELRYINEPSRHKLLDLVGDLTLVGCALNAHIIANKPGHASNVALAKHLKNIRKKAATPPAQQPPAYDPNATPHYNIIDIQNTLPHRAPFLLIDKIMEQTDNHVIAIKNVTFNEPFFQGHFPGQPVMPGVLIIEALAQAGGMLLLNTVPDPQNYVTFFLKLDEVKFRKPVVPGDTLIFKLVLLGPIRRGICQMKGEAFVGKNLVAEGILTAQLQRRTIWAF